MVRNEHYHGPAPELDEVEVTILDSADALAREYELFTAGALDLARIPPALVSAAQAAYPDGFLEQDLAGVNYLLPFLMNPPLHKREAREAISLAIDRDAIIAEVFGGFRTKATSLVPPAFAGVHEPGLAASCVAPDPDRAVALAAEAGLTPGTRVDLAYNTGGGHDEWVTAVAGQLRATLGLDIRLSPMTPRELVEYRTGPRATGLCRAAWACDYPTADNILYPLLYSACTNPDAGGVAHGDNEGRYADEEFDELIRAARASSDAAERDKLYRRAEQIAIGRDLAIIPLWYRTHQRVYDASRFTGLALDFFGNPTLSAVRSRPATADHQNTTIGGNHAADR
jgi:oligopeptide transport system substrate-binding protein